MPPWLIHAIHQQTHKSWHSILHKACRNLSPDYLTFLTENDTWLPGKAKIFNAFSLPLEKTHYILYGESPYPRKESANGFAFWDQAVKEIWSETSLSKKVNRATSLRNFLKMLLQIENPAQKIQTLDELFHNLLQHGFLLLNFNLSLSTLSKTKEAKEWQVFHASLLEQLALEKKNIQLVLLGNIAKRILAIPASTQFSVFTAEHPYNLSFIQNETVKAFFKPFHLLQLASYMNNIYY